MPLAMAQDWSQVQLRPFLCWLPGLAGGHLDRTLLGAVFGAVRGLFAESVLTKTLQAAALNSDVY